MVDKGLPNQALGLPQMNLLGGIPFLPFDSAFFFLPSNSQIPFSLFFATESISLFILLNRSEQGVFIGDETGVRRPKSVLKTKIVTTSSQTNNRDQGFEQNPNHLFPFSNVRQIINQPRSRSRALILPSGNGDTDEGSHRAYSSIVTEIGRAHV